GGPGADRKGFSWQVGQALGKNAWALEIGPLDHIALVQALVLPDASRGLPPGAAVIRPTSGAARDPIKAMPKANHESTRLPGFSSARVSRLRCRNRSNSSPSGWTSSTTHAKSKPGGGAVMVIS